MNRPPSIRTAAGFTLLEAIVAMTIFSMTALALYGWQSVNLRTLERLESHAARADHVRSALAVLEAVNPAQEPSGERRLGDKRVRWRAEPIEPMKTGRTFIGQPSLFDLGLYDVEVSLEEQGRTLASFHVRQVGYQQPRKTEFE
jgi:general secretion pathway protein I